MRDRGFRDEGGGRKRIERCTAIALGRDLARGERGGMWIEGKYPKKR